MDRRLVLALVVRLRRLVVALVAYRPAYPALVALVAVPSVALV